MISSKVLSGMGFSHNKQTLLVYLKSAYWDNLLLSNLHLCFQNINMIINALKNKYSCLIVYGNYLYSFI